jgi:hypothetical protein
LFTQANTYSPLACGAGPAVAELAVLLYPALVVPLKLTDFTRTAPLAIPARATTATVRVLDFMIILIRGKCAVAARDKGIIRSRGIRHQPGREVCR